MGALRALAVACAFLTRFPWRLADTRESDMGRSIAFFPVVGLALGLCLALLVLLAGRLTAPAVLAVGAVALLAGLTGGLHLDGVADVFDGLSGGHGERARTLAIMRDSRIGAHGAVALMLVVLAKVFALIAIVQHGDWRVLTVFPAVARWCAVPLVVFFPYVRQEGVGRAFNDRGSAKEWAWATVFIVGIVFWLGVRFLQPALVAAAVALLFGVWMQRRLGGVTGDVYGAAIELAEVVFLIAVRGGG